MGGTISVESVPGEGAQFRFSIVVDRANHPAPVPSLKSATTPRPSAVKASQQLRVLVAEDNEINQKVALMYLARLGVEARVVADGVKAIEAVLATEYDLVLMDIQMPELDGLEATRQIRSSLPLDRQPIIFGVTAHATADYQDVCLAAGMDGWLPKPLDREKLRELITDLSLRLLSNKLGPSEPKLNDSAPLDSVPATRLAGRFPSNSK
jgi:CheY-like chemotaxis protein